MPVAASSPSTAVSKAHSTTAASSTAAPRSPSPVKSDSLVTAHRAASTAPDATIDTSGSLEGLREAPPHRNGVKRALDTSDSLICEGSSSRGDSPSAASVSGSAGPKHKRTQMLGYAEDGPSGANGGVIDGMPQAHPSRVLLFRGLTPSVNEMDIEQLVAPFCHGQRPKIYLQGTAGHAFVEFADEQTASAALQYVRMHQINLKGSVVQPTFSRRDSVTTLEEKVEPFRVVLASVTNIVYPVDIELISFLFSKYGIVEKIVTFSKTTGMYQALVQFAEQDQARSAMHALNNRNIYDGCNSLQIQPSRLQELTVKINNARSWDFTNPSATQTSLQAASQQAQSPQAAQSRHFSSGGGQGTQSSGGVMGGHHHGGGAMQQQQMQQQGGPMNSSLLPTPQGAVGYGGFGGDMKGGHPMDMSGGMPPMMHMHHAQQMQQMPHQMGGNPQMMVHGGQGLMVGGGGMGGHHPGGRGQHAMLVDRLPRELKDIGLDAANPNQTPVVIVYNLSSTDVTVMKLFNLFSLYGNVTRIKVLRDKPDTALIQFSEASYATIAYNFLQGAPVFNEEAGIQISYSKNTEVKLPPQGSSDTEADLRRTRAFNMRDQRYGQVDDMDKYLRGASRPMRTLFIANIHEDCTEDEVKEIFTQEGEVTGFKFRPGREGSKKRMAFVEMSSEKQSIQALCNLHNHRLRDANIKVAFSKTVIATPGSGSRPSASSS